MARVAILDYGMGNLRSVARAVERAGAEPVVTPDAAAVARADALVVPGVGAFGACMANLRRAGLEGAIHDFATSGRPLVGVCLGMQVLFDHSEEGDARGLGILEGDVRRLPDGVKVPHMGWNDVRWTADHPLVRGLADGTRFYFVHSYVCDPAEDVGVGEAEHGRRFAAAVARDNIFAVQFHPEKSGEAGLEIYRNLVKELG
ncbi:MAG TPA: imidazole glycerol phosphate synthase subunit HisH [Actinomycetota bacterium]|nr:imidazole glycerol phosphate synthase subunit HisH [Actinomycetota bacterium]